jgi:hypothetical protein
MRHIEITDDMVAAYGVAWAQADLSQESGPEPGTRRRAGLAACMEVLQRTHRIIPKSAAPEGVALDLDAIESKWLQPCPVCDAGLSGSCTHPDEDYRPVMLELVHHIERLRFAMERLDLHGDYGAVFVVAHLLDRLGVSEILVSNEDLEKEDRRTITVSEDFPRMGWIIKVKKEPRA